MAETTLSQPVMRLPSAAASEAAALISMIERAAADPAIDIERVERMYAMYERAAARNARSAYDQALADMAPKLPVIERSAQILHGTKLIARYARWEDIAIPVTKVLAEHGFSLSFKMAQEDAKVVVTAILAHRDGHREETSFPFPLDSGPGRSAIQAVGSSVSYGKRYAASLLLNIVTKDEDTDGALPTSDTITTEQADQIVDMMEAVGADRKKFFEHFKVRQVTELTTTQFEAAKMALRRKGAK